MSLTAPTITGYSAFWQLTGDRTPYNFLVSQPRNSAASVIARAMKKQGNRDAIAAIAALIGATAGGTATATHKVVSNPLGPSNTVPGVMALTALGGNRTIDTATDINRVTTAADVTELKKWFNNALLASGITYPTTVGLTATQSGGQVNNVTRF